MAIRSCLRFPVAAKRLLSPSQVPSRSFWAWLNDVWNRVDENRIKEVGADRAAAEWLIRCGAGVKWKNQDRFDRQYDNLVRIRPKDKILAIDATDSTISHVGFPYLKGLTEVEEFVIERNPYLRDEALVLLKFLQPSLLSLRLVSCVNVTDQGIKSLVNLNRLKQLYLSDLMTVTNATDCVNVLKSGLPDCEIISKLK